MKKNQKKASKNSTPNQQQPILHQITNKTITSTLNISHSNPSQIKQTITEPNQPEQISFQHFVSGIYESAHSHRKLPNYTNTHTHQSSSNLQYQLQISKLTLQNKQLVRQISHKTEKINKIKEECEQYRKGLRNRESEIKKLGEKWKEREQVGKKEVEEMRKKLERERDEAISKARQTSKQQITKYKDIIQKMKQKATQQQKTHQQQQQQTSSTIKQLTDKIQLLTKDLRIKDKQITKYQQIIQQRSQYYDTTIQTKNNQINQLRQQLIELTKQLQTENTTINIQAQIQLLNINIEQLKQQLQTNEHKLLQKQQIISKSKTLLQQLTSIIQVTQEHQQHQYKTNNHSTIPTKNPTKGLLQQIQQTKNHLLQFIKLTKQILKNCTPLQKDSEYHRKIRKYFEDVVGIQQNMNILVDENNYLRGQIDKGLLVGSVDFVGSDRSNRRIKDIYSGDGNSGVYPGREQGIFRMRLMDLQRQRKFHSLDEIPQRASQPNLHPPPKQSQFQSNTNTYLSQFQSKSTNYFIQQTQKPTKVIQQPPLLNYKEQKLKIREEIQKAKQIFTGTNIKEIVSGKKGGERFVRNRSLPVLKRESLSWRKPKSKMLVQYAI